MYAHSLPVNAKHYSWEACYRFRTLSVWTSSLALQVIVKRGAVMKYSATVSSSRRKSRKVRGNGTRFLLYVAMYFVCVLMVMAILPAGSLHCSIEREEKAHERSSELRAQEQVWGALHAPSAQLDFCSSIASGYQS